MSGEKISIVIPYNGAEKLTAVWAEEERKIDFRNDAEKAARCTMAFAAVELKKYLLRTLNGAEISFSFSIPNKDFIIILQIINKCSKDDRFSIVSCQNRVVITGQGRTGVLYGAYEFLRIQGWRWYAPGKEGEIAPKLKNELDIPVFKKEYVPSMDLGRGFYFEGVSRESSELWLWMARNRLNLTTFRPATGALGNKLGMIFRVGGHIFEDILNPDRVMASGRTLWEEHENWYGLPVDGIRNKDKALNTQFCVSQPDLLEFLGNELLNRLNDEWKDADQIDIWGFDTWGSNCTCAGCRSLGNGTDQTLFFISALKKIIDMARNSGSLEHDVKLVACAYEGTSTISGPMNSFPENLIESGDYITFFPITRCYAHGFKDSSCAVNKFYSNAMECWFQQQPHMPVMIGEYYNVSKFEDLPILFTSSMKRDFPGYHTSGVRGSVYMHVPLVNWGIRTLTQVLYAQLAWDVDTDMEAFLIEYFYNWYGPCAEDMRKVYNLMEKAWLFSAEWRAWFDRSVLTQLQLWDGTKPKEPLKMDNHFMTPSGAIESGRQSINYMQEAKKILTEVRMRDKVLTAEQYSGNIQVAVNPLEASRLVKEGAYEMRLGEDNRLLMYGLDTMVIMTELVAYHDALYRNNLPEAEEVWRRIEEVEERLDSYYVPIGFEEPGAGLVSKDALTRTQVRDLLRRIRKYRNKIDKNSTEVYKT